MDRMTPSVPRSGLILIVDDTTTNLKVVGECMSDCGYHVVIAEDGEEALRRAALVRPDLILLDVMLPDVDGFEVCRRLKADPDTRDIPVIFMTALVDTEHKLKGFAVGAIDYVTKPLQIEEVLARVNTHMRLRWLQTALEDKHAELQRSHDELERRVAERTAELSDANRALRLEIQERQQAEERLALKNFALDHVREGAFLLDEDSVILYVNDAACRMSGYRRDELLAMRASDLDPEWSHEAYRQSWARLRSAGNVVGEAQFRARDGRPLYVEVGENYFEHGGRGYDLVLVRDISAAKEADAALRESERRFRTLAENSPDLIVRYDLDCRRLYVNPAYTALSDITADDAIAREPGEHWYGDISAPDYKDMLRSVMKTGKRAENVMSWYVPGAAPAHYIFHIVPEFDQDGTVRCVLTIGRDITAFKESERELRESRRELRELAARQHTMREEERKHIARELHDELGQFLTALRMKVSLLRVHFGGDNPGLVEHAKSMTELVDRNIEVVRHVATSLRPAALDMGIESALEWLVDEFARHVGIACTLDVADRDVVLDDMSGTTIFRIVQESLTNVARHAGAGRVAVTLDSEAHFCRVTVRDDGRGFDPARSRKTSLGLLGMRERVLAVGGELDIDSAPGQGTALTVRVPRVQSAPRV
jgi:PAS domain S-box-containing protein